MKQFAIFITTNMKNRIRPLADIVHYKYIFTYLLTYQVACKQPIKHQQLTTYSNAVWVLHQSHITTRHLVNRLAAILHQIPINFSVTFCHSVFNMSLKLLLTVLKVPVYWIFTNTCTKEQQQTMRWQKTQTQRYSVHYACCQSQRQQWWHSIHRQRTRNVQVRGQCEMARACCWRQQWWHSVHRQRTINVQVRGQCEMVHACCWRQQWWHSIHRQRTINVQVRGQCEMARACCWRQQWWHSIHRQRTTNVQVRGQCEMVRACC